MKSNYIIVIIVAVLAIVAMVFLNKRTVVQYVFQNQNNSTSTAPVSTGGNQNTIGTSGSGNVLATSPAPAPSKNTGRVVFTVTDDAVGLENLQSIMMTVSDISVKNSAGTWISVSKGAQVFDLIDLYKTSRNVLYVDTNLNPGTYNVLRVT